jgi:hypothetical protein
MEVKSLTGNAPTIKNEENRKYKPCGKRRVDLRNLQEYTEVLTWLRTVSDKSGKLYLKILEKFCEFCGKTPSELILER